MKATDIYQSVTDRLIDDIKQGLADPKGWQKPWASFVTAQRNATTQVAYTGFNQFILQDVGASMPCPKGDECDNQTACIPPVWATFKQWEGIGAQVCKGQKGTHLIKMVVGKAKCGHKRTIPGCGPCKQRGMFPVGFVVFNASQVDGYTYTPTSPPSEAEVFAAGEAIVEAAKADGVQIRNIETDSAYFEPSRDAITLPLMSWFESTEAYYATVLHELGHSTSIAKRCDRDFGQKFGDQKYAFEELVAEFASAFMSSAIGLDDSRRAMHGNYLANWLQVLENDPKALAHAASKAQAAADYWLSRVAKVEVENETENVAA